MTKKPGTTNDHIVPRMYLRRFGVPRSNGHVLAVARADTPAKSFQSSVNNVAVEKGFYWGTDPGGVPHHQIEELFNLIETGASLAFRVVLGDGRTPTDDAVPYPWPPRTEVRISIAWWIAAQLLRTAPHRERLWELQGEGIEVPGGLERANPHLAFIIQRIAPLAALIASRPWGAGFTTTCLFTSDVPVQILNARVDEDPIRSVAFWDVYVPLDPHRFLFLPGRMYADRRDLMRDHRMALDSFLTVGLNQLHVEWAHRHVFWHPDHDPRPTSDLETAVKIRRSRFKTGGSSTLVNYGTIGTSEGVERRWLVSHPGAADVDDRPKAPSRSDDDLLKMFEAMVGRIDSARAEYDEGTGRTQDTP